jgi:hypothetical protein
MGYQQELLKGTSYRQKLLKGASYRQELLAKCLKAPAKDTPAP